MRSITQRELRNQSGEIMRGLDAGETFVVTRNGVPVATLVPRREDALATRGRAVAMFSGAALVDGPALRASVDAFVDQNPYRVEPDEAVASAGPSHRREVSSKDFAHLEALVRLEALEVSDA